MDPAIWDCAANADPTVRRTIEKHYASTPLLSLLPLSFPPLPTLANAQARTCPTSSRTDLFFLCFGRFFFVVHLSVLQAKSLGAPHERRRVVVRPKANKSLCCGVEAVVTLTLDPKRPPDLHPNRPKCATESANTSGHKWRQRSALFSSNRFSSRIGALCVPTLVQDSGVGNDQEPWPVEAQKPEGGTRLYTGRTWLR